MNLSDNDTSFNVFFLGQVLRAFSPVETYCMYMTWLTSYQKKQELQEEMLQNMSKPEKSVNQMQKKSR